MSLAYELAVFSRNLLYFYTDLQNFNILSKFSATFFGIFQIVDISDIFL